VTDQTTPNEAITERDDEREDASPFPWPVEDEAVLERVKDCRKRADSALADWYEDARIDFQFAEGKQWSDDDALKLSNEHRIAAVFNRCGPIINAILGQEVTNRQEVRYLPRRVGEVNAADSMNGAVKWVREQCNAEDEDSDAFSDMVTCGMGWTCTRMDYEQNPEGMPEVMRRDPLLMRWDVGARRKNLADAAWVQADYWMDQDAIEARWPKADLDGMVNLAAPNETKAPHNATEAWKYQNDQSGVDAYDDQLRAIHHVERYTVARYRMVDPASGQMREYGEQEYDNLKKNAKAAGVEVPECVTIKTRVYWQAWTCGDTVLESGKAPAQREFPYQAMTCYRERETGYWYGVVRMMRDPQRYANRLMSPMMSILATGPKGGLLYETGAFANPKKAKTDWAKHDSVIELNPGAIAGQKVQPKPPQAMPPGAAELMQFAIASIRDVTGVNVDMLGGADRDQPGIVEDMRTKAGLTILAKVFDALRLYRKRQGILLAEFVEKFISDGRLVRIMGKAGEQFIPLLRQDALEYDVVVDESPAARDVKERSWMALQQMIPGMLQAGMPVPPSVLDYAPIPQSLAVEWKQMIFQQMQQGPKPSPIVEAEQIKAQAKLQEQQTKLAADAQIEQIKAQTQAQMESLKAQKSLATEQAQMQADLAVEQMKVQMQGAIEQMKAQFTMDLEAMKNSRAQETELATARIRAMAQIASARIAQGVDNEDDIAQSLQVASLTDSAGVLTRSQRDIGSVLVEHDAVLRQLGDAIVGLHATVAAPRRLVRDGRGKAVASVVEDAPDSGGRFAQHGPGAVTEKLTRQEAMLEQLGQAVVALQVAVSAPRKLVRGANGRPVGSVIDHGVLQ
jgi:hypothetical protein